MGSGKTTAMISLINTDPRKHFLYVTPYLTEVERIKKNCGFKSPKQLGEGKLNSLHWLLKHKQSIACTHVLFTMFTDETLRLIKEGRYILILDETLESISNYQVIAKDLEMAKLGGLIEEDEKGCIHWKDESYEFGWFYNLRKQLEKCEIWSYAGAYFTVMKKEVFDCFKDVFVLTYMFDHQMMGCWARMKNIPCDYYYIESGILMQGRGGFGNYEGIKYLINIVDSPRLNEIGRKKTALSAGWYDSAPTKDIERVRKNTLNLYHNIYRGTSKEAMWTCFKRNKQQLAGTGYTSGFVSCNTRATNEYSGKNNLAYLVNRYPIPVTYNFLKSLGVTIDKDGYALSEMVQWVWRSAIRNKEKINIYIPSSRMRKLFSDWLDEIDFRKEVF